MKRYYIIANHSLSENELINLFNKSKHGAKEVHSIKEVASYPEYKYEISY
jgi:hypothetical protein